MENREALYAALRNADAAGDTKGAASLAQYIQSLGSQGKAQPTITGAINRPAYSPADGGVIENMAAGAGKAFADTGLGLKQIGAGIGNAVGLVDDSTVTRLKRQATEAEQRDAPLMHTRAGIGANAATNALLSIASWEAGGMLPGAGAVTKVVNKTGVAAPYVKAAGNGALFGTLQPVDEQGSRATNAGLGAVGGVAGTAIGQGVGGLAGVAKNKLVEMAARRQAGNALVDTAAQNARQAGYVIPTTSTNPDSTINQVLEGLMSGKIKTAQAASTKNQPVTQLLVKRDLGIPEDVPLSIEAVRGVRKAAGAAYDNIRNAGGMVADKQFLQNLNDVASRNAGANRSFPGLVSHDAEAIVAPLRQPGFDAGDAIDAIRHLRSMADASFAKGEPEAAKTAIGAAQALEDLVERNLQQAGNGSGLDAFRQARQLMAKTYSVEKAMNPSTGMIDATRLAAELKKGKPLTGGMRTIAETSAAFPKATQALKEDLHVLSPLDYGVGILGMTGSGSPIGAAAIASRPLARAVALSPAYQRLMGSRSYDAPATNALLGYLQTPQFQRAATIAGLLSPQMQGQ